MRSIVIAGCLVCASVGKGYAQVVPGTPALASSVPIPSTAAQPSIAASMLAHSGQASNLPVPSVRPSPDQYGATDAKANVAVQASPDVAVPATPHVGDAWQAKAAAEVARIKQQYYQQIKDTAAKPKVSSEQLTELQQIQKSGSDYVNHPGKTLGRKWAVKTLEQSKADTKEYAAAVAPIANEAPSKLQKELDAAAKMLGVESPTNDQIKAFTAKQKDDKPKYVLLVSQSMGNDAIRDAMHIDKNYGDMAIAFRGMKPGQTLYQLAEYLGHLRKTAPKMGDRLPYVILDPVYFEDVDAKVVPTLIEYGKDGKPIAQVEGVVNPKWLDEQIANGRRGDLGKRGPTYSIAEPDMIKVMQAKAAQFNGQKWAEAAVQNFWKRFPLVNLPKATKHTVFTVDPTVVVTRDLCLPNGKCFAKKGERFNPLLLIGFHQKMLIFDETDPKQLAYAKQFVHANPNITTMLITTAVNRKDGWTGYRTAENKIRHAIYVLNESIVRTWKLRAVPSVITAKGPVFVVTEVPVDTKVTDKGESHADDHKAQG